MKKITLLIFIIASNMSVIYAQGIGDLNMTPLSPNAASLVKDINIPVSYYTGVPAIDVPFFSLPTRADNKVASVGISYNASGIKVQEVASQVGLGWSLQAGGMITRVVRDNPDEPGDNMYPDGELSMAQIAGEIGNTQPDIFYYNFLGRSGKFFFDNDGDAYTMPYEAIDIKHTIHVGASKNEFQKWTITDEEGYQYVFGETSVGREESSIKRTNQELEEYRSTWYLEKVNAANGTELFNIEYYQGGDVAVKYYHESGYFVANTSCANAQSSYVNKLETTNTTKAARYIKNINSSQGQIHFTYSSTERVDLANAWNLKEVILKNNSGIAVKKFAFEYGNFTGQKARWWSGFVWTGETVACGDYGDEHCRLRLDRILEKSNESSKSYRAFDYNMEEDLPSRDQVFEDHWGYYNSRRSSMYLNKPTDYSGYYSRMPSIETTDGSTLYSGATKIPDYASTAANILQEIIYPTGGSTKFIYEGNSSVAMGERGGLRVKEIVNITDGDEIDKRTFEYEEGSSFGIPQYSYIIDKYEITSNSSWNFLIFSITDDCETEVIIASSSSFISLFDLDGYQIGYGKVTETFSDGGHIVRHYSNFNEHPDDAPINFSIKEIPRYGNVNYLVTKTDAFLLDHNNYSDADVRSALSNNVSSASVFAESISDVGPPFTPTSSKFWERGNLKLQQTYDVAGQRVSETSYRYDYLASIKGSKTGVTILNIGSFSGGTLYTLGHYLLTSKPIFLKEVISTSFDQSDQSKTLTTISEYHYNNEYLQLSQEVTHNPNEDLQYVTDFYYAADLTSGMGQAFVSTVPFASEGIWFMPDKTIPIEIVNKKVENGVTKIIGAQVNRYGWKWNWNYSTNQGDVYSRPSALYSLKLNAPIDESSYTNYAINDNKFGIVIDPNLELVHSYNNYTEHGNLKKETYKDGTVKEYVWGYNSSLLTQVTVNDDQLTTYVHKPLVGVTQVTDPNGEKTKYEYDDFNRLSIVRDNDNKILKRYRYHYKGQVEGLSANFDYSGVNQINTTINFVSDSNEELFGETIYLWDYGDGTTEERSTYTAYHSYANAGTYTAKLTVINPDYETVQYTKSVSIYENLLSVDICISGPRITDLCGVDDPVVGTNCGPGSALVTSIVANTIPGASCGSPYRYTYKYKLSTATSWTTFGTDDPMAIFPEKSTVGTYYIKCELRDGCNTIYTSNQVAVVYTKSQSNCSVNMQ